MADKNFTELGRQMSDAVQDAIQSGDYTRLKQTVNATVQTVVEKTVSFERNLEETMNRKTYGGWKPPVNKQSPPFYGPPREKRENTGWRPYTPPTPPQRKAAPEASSRPLVVQWKTRYKAHLRKVSFSKAKGLAMLIFGAVCAPPFGTMTLFGVISALKNFAATAGGFNFWFDIVLALVFFLPCTVLFIWLAVKGFQIHRSAGRYQQYYAMLGEASFCKLAQLAATVGKPEPFVKKELSRMISTGLLPEGYMDQQETCVMLGAETYRQYCEAMENKKQREQAEAQKAQEPEGLAAVIAEGRECIRVIHEANNALPGEEISVKLSRLETVTTKIFAYVEQHPAKLPEIRRFMEYYLPTTVKLVGSYREFASQSVQGENIVTAQKEIQEILMTINSAFETLLDSLFADDAIDISTDISALKTMLAQEGLSQKDFK